MTQPITIYHNPRCSKSRDTLARIQGAGLRPTIIEYLHSPPSPAELDAILTRLGLQPIDIVRTGEPAYAELGLAARPPADRAAWLQVLADHPALLQRPIVVRGDRACIGRPPENVDPLLRDA